MSRRNLWFTFVLLATAQFAVAQDQAAVVPTTSYDQVTQRLSAAIQYEVRQKRLPGFSISLVADSRNIWSAGYGFRDREGKKPATADTVYRVGSVSKLFTDIAVMKLVEQGKLNLDAPAANYLPSFHPQRPNNTPITLRHLMSHRSGLVRESPVGNYFDPTQPTLTETVASLNRTSLVYPTDTRTKYSNAAVAVVGAVLQEQLRGDFADEVANNVFAPLRMKDSGFILAPHLQAKLATAWMWTYDDRRFVAPTFLLGTSSAGNLYSSVNDLAKFLICIFNDGYVGETEVIQADTLGKMITPQLDTDGKPQRFGIGFHVAQFEGYQRIGHGGAVYGFATQLEALPQRKIGVAAATSLDGSNGVVRRICDYAFRLLLARQDNQPLPMYRTTTTVPTERRHKLVGTYSNGDEITRVSAYGDRLLMQRGSFRYELRAADDDGSILTDDVHGFGTTVSLDDQGNLIVDSTTYQREADIPPAAPPEHFRGLIGEYGWDHNTLYILEDRGQLVALIEWFYRYPLTEINENEFAFPDFGLYHGERLKFARDAGGRATHVMAAEVRFARREVGTKDGETFKIKPVRPIDDLRTAALAAQPPAEAGDFRDSELVDLAALDPTIQLDVRYATTNNFMGAVFYRQPRAFMQRPAAEAVVRVHQKLQQRGLGLLIHDAYRPWHVTKMFWDATPSKFKDFVANPAKGSRHNRGCAVDLTLYDLATGKPIQMVAGYDEFSARSFPLYPGGTSRQRWYRELLRTAMKSEQFDVYEYEWWHFDFHDWKHYRIGNVTFEDL